MPDSPRVLIYDPNEGSADTLSELLKREGVCSQVVPDADRLRALCDSSAVAALVIDAESAPRGETEFLRSACHRAIGKGAAILVIGSKRPGDPLFERGEFVRKPYHYGPLVHRILNAAAGEGSVSSRAA